MAKNIFIEREEYAQDRPRNVFDLSFSNHLTMKFGTLYPVFCKEVLPGDSFSIKTAFGLQFMPLVFPVQTRMRAHMHFFYVRNRNLWKDWPDYIYGTKDNLDFPVISQPSNSKFWSTGSLSDYLGVPTTICGKYGNYQYLRAAGTSSSQIGSILRNGRSLKELILRRAFESGQPLPQSGSVNISTVMNVNQSFLYYLMVPSTTDWTLSQSYGSGFDLIWENQITDYAKTSGFSSAFADYPCVPFLDPVKVKLATGTWTFNQSTYTRISLPQSNVDVSQLISVSVNLFVFVGNQGDGYLKSRLLSRYVPYKYNGSQSSALSGSYLLKDASGTFIALSNSAAVEINNLIDKGREVYFVLGFSERTKDMPDFCDSNLSYSSSVTGAWSRTTFGSVLLYAPDSDDVSNRVFEINDGLGTANPYGNGGSEVISALPYRAYESIYNGFYRNQQNNPFRINGQVEYNKYVTTNDGGTDTTYYKLEQRDWEKDFLTSAVQSPQAGIAPLVGLVTDTTPLGKITLRDPDTNGNNTIQFEFASDGETVKGFKTITDLNPTTAGLLVNAISMGLSINDFRQTNALQRWLETNMRRGFRYRDLTKGQYDVDIKYDEVDMPEFIGGFSRDVNVTPIHQMVNSTETPLGDIAGNASMFAQSENEITHFCDEHGFIMGILSIVPEPAYSQLIPKHFLKTTSPLDYYFPEFGKIGMTPIQYKEVAPVQVYAEALATSKDPTDELNSVFGYQRAWYDYIASTNEVHGELRTSLRPYLMNRTFDEKPVLGAKFLRVDPKQLNDVFAVQYDDDDKIVGQIIFDVSAKRQIPRMGIPALE